MKSLKFLPYLLALLVALAIVAVIVWIPRLSREDIMTLAQDMQPGMTMEEIKTIAGDPDSQETKVSPADVNSDDAPERVYWYYEPQPWEEDQMRITVYFVDNAVIAIDVDTIN